MSGLWKYAGLAFVLVTACGQLIPTPVPAADQPQKAEEAKKPPTDLYGDPLPEGAVARLGTVRMRHEGYVTSVSYSPDGQLLATTGTDETIRLWEYSTGKELRRLELRGRARPSQVAFSPDGTMLAVGGGTQIRIWEVATGKELLAKDHLHPIHCVAFSPDSKTLASGGTDRTDANRPKGNPSALAGQHRSGAAPICWARHAHQVGRFFSRRQAAGFRRPGR